MRRRPPSCPLPPPRLRQVRDGKVQNVTAAEAGQLVKDGWVLLDVRPPTEIAQVRFERGGPAVGLWGGGWVAACVPPP